MTQPGIFELSLDHGIKSATSLQPAQIIITTFTDGLCTSYCSAISNSNGLEIGTTDRCQCLGSYKWDHANKLCIQTCATILYTMASAGPTCTCIGGYRWDSSLNACIINCSNISYAL